MELLTWTPVLFAKKEFPRDKNGKPFLPGNVIKEGITSAFIYYYIKKDKEIENRIKAYLLKEELEPKEVINRIKTIISEKYPDIFNFQVAEKIELLEGEIYTTTAEVFHLKRWEEIESFKVEVFKGKILLPLKIKAIEKLKAAGHSFCEALARMEMKMLGEHPLVETFYQPLLNSMKKWEIPLRIGMWTETRFRGNLLFFWRIKEVRNKLFEELKTDIRPTKIIYLPREKATAGWCEIKI